MFLVAETTTPPTVAAVRPTPAKPIQVAAAIAAAAAVLPEMKAVAAVHR